MVAAAHSREVIMVGEATEVGVRVEVGLEGEVEDAVARRYVGEIEMAQAVPRGWMRWRSSPRLPSELRANE